MIRALCTIGLPHIAIRSLDREADRILHLFGECTSSQSTVRCVVKFWCLAIFASITNRSRDSRQSTFRAKLLSNILHIKYVISLSIPFRHYFVCAAYCLALIATHRWRSRRVHTRDLMPKTPAVRRHPYLPETAIRDKG
jgi:hypothetical protein